jgi:RsiW-degrading membrane proteinase PrsW (M82 family)
MLEALRWFLPTALPPALAVVLWRRTDRPGPRSLAILTFCLGAAAGGATLYLSALASRWSGLDVRTSVVGEGAALLFLFCLVAPLGEAATVVASWPAFLSDHFGDPYDGVVYPSLAALGFAMIESGVVLRQNPEGTIWIARVLLSVPAHVFFAAVWGYALGRAKQGLSRRASMFPVAWLVATASHGLYVHIVFGRGPGAALGVVPLLLAMAVVSWVAVRDLSVHGAGLSAAVASRMSRTRLPRVATPPTLNAVRDALRRRDQPIKVRWILVGALVTIGTMFAGLAASVAFGHWAHIDFSVVDEHDVATTVPLALLGIGLLTAFPVSGFLVARASNVPTLLEPALASALAIGAVCVVLGLMAPIALVFAFAFSPIAFGLACAGAWVGLPTA